MDVSLLSHTRNREEINGGGIRALFFTLLFFFFNTVRKMKRCLFLNENLKLKSYAWHAVLVYELVY